MSGTTIKALRGCYDTGWTQIAGILKTQGVYAERRRNGWNQAERAERNVAICQQYQEGATLSELAELFGISKPVISKVLLAAGVETRGVKRTDYRIEFTEEQVADIVTRYQTGTTGAALAREYGCSQAPIDRVLKAAGVHEPRRSLVGARFTAEERAELVRRYEAGESIYKLAEAFGVVAQSLHKVLVGLGVTMRTKGGKYPGVPLRRVDPESGYVKVKPAPDDVIGQAMVWANGQVFEHRLVMAHHLQRPLLLGENVHHVHGDKTNNRLGELELWSTAQPKGQRVEDLIPFWVEQLGRYGDVVFTRTAPPVSPPPTPGAAT